MTAVLTVSPAYSLVHEIRYSNFIANMGDGHEQRVNKNLNWGPRGDGLGGTSAVYKGQNVFKLTFKNLIYGTSKSANTLWAFYVARLGNYEPFYFYNPIENAPDPNGAETTGRYLVRFADGSMTREQFMWCAYNSSVDLIEVRA